jgi:hypothetical protein
MDFRRSHLSSTLGYCGRGEKGKAAPRKNRGGAKGQMTGRGLADL